MANGVEKLSLSCLHGSVDLRICSSLELMDTASLAGCGGGSAFRFTFAFTSAFKEVKHFRGCSAGSLSRSLHLY